MGVTKKFTSVLPVLGLERRIFVIRGEKVILSSDLAILYEVEPRVLVQAAKRNYQRFPTDFMFQLTPAEFLNLKSQFVISSWGGLRRALPYAFTELGVAMLSSVLKSEKAIQVNIEIMRAFVKIRAVLAAHKELAKKIEILEKKYNTNFAIIFKFIEDTIKSHQILPSAIGFNTKKRT